MTFYEIIGLVGAALYLSSYGILQYHRNFARSITYSVMNLLAAGAVLVSLSGDWNLAAYIIQLAWLIISTYGLYRCFFSVRRAPSDTADAAEHKTLAEQTKDG